jgi:hypothetical protein
MRPAPTRADANDGGNAQVQSLALILTFLALLIAIGLDMLLVRLIGEVTTAGKGSPKKNAPSRGSKRHRQR